MATVSSAPTRWEGSASGSSPRPIAPSPPYYCQRSTDMPCELCGRGDMWIKTCLTPEGSRILICDPCYEEHASVLVIVPGDRVVMARCDSCWRYGNPRDFVEVSPGGRKNAYSGTCAECAGEGS